MTTHTEHEPNHHAHYPGFAGPSGLLAALSMTFGREADAAFAIQLTRAGATDRIVDVGCGPGAAVRRAARAGAHVTGIDPAPVMLRVARALGGGSRVTYREGRAEALPVGDGAATVVWTIASAHHWPDIDAGIAEVLRVLEPGGRFVAIERSTRPGATGLAGHGWTDERAEAFAGLCRDAGFVGVHLDRRDGGRRPLVAVSAAKP
jgi:ubiquinone/menaquinone biosynthesis C-methylase UbiE